MLIGWLGTTRMATIATLVIATFGTGCVTYTELAAYPASWPPYVKAAATCQHLAGTYLDLGEPARTNEDYDFALRVGQRYSLAEFFDDGTPDVPLEEFKQVDGAVTLTVDATDAVAIAAEGRGLPQREFEVGCEHGALRLTYQMKLPEIAIRRRDFVAKLHAATDGSLILELQYFEQAELLSPSGGATTRSRTYYRFIRQGSSSER